MMLAAILCMAEAVYFEARSEPVLAQFAVAQVVQNRIQDPRFPAAACEVVHAPAAFSYYWDGKPEDVHNRQAWATAVYVSALVTWRVVPDLTGGARHYHKAGTRPRWASGESIQIGAHVFYAGVP